MSEISFQLLKHQAALLEDTTTKYLCLTSGYGGGKSFCAVIKMLQLAFLNVGYRSIILEPTHTMAVDVIIPMIMEVLDTHSIPYSYRASPLPSFVLHFEKGDHEVLIRSAENYRRLAGLNLAFFICDEFDTVEKKLALRIFQMLQSRLRKGNVLQGVITSTPEGYSAMYELFVVKAGPDRKLIKAKTTDNPFLPASYIENLYATYPANLISAYINGEFVNLNNSVVYSNFDRHIHNTDMTINSIKNSVTHIGIDFNIGNTTGIVFIINNGVPYVVDEITKQQDTRALIETIKRKYPNRVIVVYPDASGDSRKTAATNTDITLLRSAGFNVKTLSKNPPVRDRINSVQALLKDGNGKVKLFINTKNCPTLTDCFEKQAYDNKGEPDKTNGFDHPLDALGYFVWFNYPLIHNKGIRVA